MKDVRTGVAPIALMAAMGFALPASAVAQSTNWSGLYFGLYAGAAWGDGKLSSQASCPPTTATSDGYFCSANNVASQANAALVGAAGSGSANSSAFNGGIQAGYNVQNGGLVFGVEGDIGSFGLKVSGSGSANYAVSYFPSTTASRFTVGTEVEAAWLATLRGRLGFTTGNVLLYITGGLALSDVKVSNTFSDNRASGGFAGATGASSSSKVRTGFVVGGGAEWAMNRNWTLKGEYLYVDLGSATTTAQITHRGFTGYTNGLSTKADIDAHIGRVGVNYKF